jgi:quercetin dioxygenase-like cupin family protein
VTNKTLQIHIQSDSIPWEQISDGIRRKILGHDSDLMMVVVEFKKGSAASVHKHPHRQVSYIEAGSFEVQVGNEKKILKKKDCFFIPPNIEHGVIALEDGCVIDVFSPAREDFFLSKS